jgi:phospholipase A1
MQGGWEWDRWQNSVSILARAWYRLPENSATDDNPDILSYLGRGEFVLRWEPEDKTQAIS